MTCTIGIDIGSGAVKTVLFRIEGGEERWLAKRCERIRRRDPMTLAEEGRDGVLADAGLAASAVDYIATTGEGENVKFATGHFYSMTTHARGGVFLDPSARAVVDIGALNGRAISIDERGKVLSYKMTSQCASGSGQFLENIARYEHDLLVYATRGLLTVPGLTLIGTAQDKASVLSFVLEGYRPEEVGKALNEEGIAVRSGHHCAQPILRRFGQEATVRPSLAFYNTCEEIDRMLAVIRRLARGKGRVAA